MRQNNGSGIPSQLGQFNSTLPRYTLRTGNQHALSHLSPRQRSDVPLFPFADGFRFDGRGPYTKRQGPLSTSLELWASDLVHRLLSTSSIEHRIGPRSAAVETATRTGGKKIGRGLRYEEPEYVTLFCGPYFLSYQTQAPAYPQRQLSSKCNAS